MSIEGASARPSTETNVAVRRLTVPVPSVREFQRTYEAAVPDVPGAQVAALLERNAPWSDMVSLPDSSAAHGFYVYSRNDARPLMSAAGDLADCVWYLMGNHAIAERMFRHDPRVMLYAPLRTVIWEDSNGAAWFSFDQPSTQFGSFADANIARVGVELDRKLADLLLALDVDVPKALLASGSSEPV